MSPTSDSYSIGKEVLLFLVCLRIVKAYIIPMMITLLGAFDSKVRMCLSGSGFFPTADSYSNVKEVLLLLVCLWIVDAYILPMMITLLGAFDSEARLWLSGSVSIPTADSYSIVKEVLLFLVCLWIVIAYIKPMKITRLGAFDPEVRMCLSGSGLSPTSDSYSKVWEVLLFLVCLRIVKVYIIPMMITLLGAFDSKIRMCLS